LKHATSIALHAYWQSRRGRTGGATSGIRATELAPLLPSLFLIELDTLAGCPFRFCGAALAMRYGRDLTDESFMALWTAEDRASLERDFEVISARTAGLVAGLLAETVGGGFIAFEMLLLPISGERNPGGACGAIGSMVRIGGHDETNRIRARLTSQSLRSVRFLPPADRTVRAVGAFDEEPAFAPLVLRQYRHLTVLQGGK
jgi:hypothetical protein